MPTVSGLFDDYADASVAVRDLHAAGISNADISIVTPDPGSGAPVPPDPFATDVANGTEGGAGAGAVLGGAGGLLAGLGLLAIPGIGPVVAGGWLLATAAGATAGAVLGGVAGGIIGALVAGGVPRHEAEVQAEGLRRGGTLVTVRVPEGEVDQAKAILDDNDAVDVDERRAAYAAEGWKGFDETAPVETTRAEWPNDTAPPRA
ncbi:MAG: hypothetical protein ACTHOR_04855 [Devosia sp.]|jgi:hypothetical protein